METGVHSTDKQKQAGCQHPMWRNEQTLCHRYAVLDFGPVPFLYTCSPSYSRSVAVRACDAKCYNFSVFPHQIRRHHSF